MIHCDGPECHFCQSNPFWRWTIESRNDSATTIVNPHGDHMRLNNPYANELIEKGLLT